ncbi:zinc ABC transporter substrate-binding protein [Kiloniella sp.]|uniref:zinc ABC transporter substrate-binding protein n=1 Tax=Kiloniella sp. TaxID=1938587 RepID=UPI003A93FCD7
MMLSRKSGLRNPLRVSLLASSIISGLSMSAAAGEAPKVAVSILPVHSLVQSIMEGVGEPELIMDKSASPHGYSMRPSQVRMLNDADMVVWVGEGLETFLKKPLSQQEGKKTVLELMDIKGITLLENRSSGQWEHDHHHNDDEHDADVHSAHDHEEEHEHEAEHDHDKEYDHDHAKDHDDHAHDEEHANEHHEEEDHGEHVHEEDHDHDHGQFDPHIWLSINNAKAIVERVGDELAKIDPDHAPTYQANVKKVMADLGMLKQDLDGQLSVVQDKPYLVFHDAYQYFEKEFSLSTVGSVTIDAERKPGAKRITELREIIRERKAACIFREPQFKPVVVDVLAENLDTNIGELDPLGSNLAKGPHAYKALMTSLGDNLVSCLAKK